MGFRRCRVPVFQVCWLLCAAMLYVRPALATEPLLFGVLNQRSVIATAEIWNPILNYVGSKSGVPLVLRMGSVAEETTAMTVRGDFDFVYTNHLFTPERDKLGFKVMARFNTPGIRGQIVTLETSPDNTLASLAGKAVAFANPDGFTGYWVPMDALLKQGIEVELVFAGNQESAMARLALGSVAAAGVNDRVMAQYARKEGLKYRVLWSSEPYMDLVVMAHPRVPAETVGKVRQALLGMADDVEGLKALQTATEKMRSDQLLTFVATKESDYDNYRQFYRHTRLTKPAK